MNARRAAWVAIFSLTLLWSAIDPKDRYTWILEVVPALAGAAILAATCRRFPLTRLLYALILMHCVVLMIGGHYTYAEVPLFDTIRPWFGFERNNYDKVGHFVQGFVPAIIAREVLLRTRAVNGAGWLNLFCVSLCLEAVSKLFVVAFEFKMTVSKAQRAVNSGAIGKRCNAAHGHFAPNPMGRGLKSRISALRLAHLPSVNLARRALNYAI